MQVRTHVVWARGGALGGRRAWPRNDLHDSSIGPPDAARRGAAAGRAACVFGAEAFAL